MGFNSGFKGLNLTEGLGVIKDGIQVFDNADSNEWRASTTTQRNVQSQKASLCLS